MDGVLYSIGPLNLSGHVGRGLREFECRDLGLSKLFVQIDVIAARGIAIVVVIGLLGNERGSISHGTGRAGLGDGDVRGVRVVFDCLIDDEILCRSGAYHGDKQLHRSGQGVLTRYGVGLCALWLYTSRDGCVRGVQDRSCDRASLRGEISVLAQKNSKAVF